MIYCARGSMSLPTCRLESVELAIAVAGAAGLGSLATLILKTHFDQRSEARGTRRAFYVELLTLLAGRVRAAEQLSTYPDGDPPPDIEADRLDRFDALLMIEASPQVRELAGKCFETLNRFWASHTMQAPITVDEHGLYQYAILELAEQTDEGRAVAMRLSLGGVHDELVAQLDALATQVRRELHGQKAA